MNISSLISGQFTEKLQTDAPLFVSFMELYYRFSEQRKSAIGVIQNHSIDMDIDTTLDEYVDLFYKQYASDLPKETALDRRLIIKLLNEIYNSKGSEKSYKLLFKVLFNIDTEYKRPADQILKASGGKWTQEAFILVEKTFGSFDVLLNADIQISNDLGTFNFVTSHTEIIDAARIRLYFDNIQLTGFQEGSELRVTKNSEIVFLGRIIKTTEKIKVISGGGDFQVGQIYRIPGTTRPTTFKVSKIENSAMVVADIIDFGYDHPQNEQHWISSYKQVPDASVTINSVGSIKTISIQDIIYDLTEQLTVDAELVYLSGSTIKPSTFATTPSDNLSDYLGARAKVELISGTVSKLPGKYLDSAGHLSDSFIRLQDNYYYQLFSYVVIADIDISQYKSNILKILHPAGLKYFATLTKTIDIDIKSIVAVDYSSVIKMNFSDSLSLSEDVKNTYRMRIYDAFNALRSYSAQEYFAEDYNYESGFDETFGEGWNFVVSDAGDTIVTDSGDIITIKNVYGGVLGLNVNVDATLLLHGTGVNNSIVIIDSSPYATPITNQGGVTISTAQSKFGGSSIYFPGTAGAFITAPKTNATFGVDPFTVELFFMSLSGGLGTERALLNWNSDLGSSSMNIRIDGFNRMIVQTAGSVPPWGTSWSSDLYSVADNVWHHFALCRDAVGLKAFFNGNLIYEAALPSNYSITVQPDDLKLGKYDNSNFFRGYMDEVRITKNIARYSANFTVPTAPY